MLCSEAELGLGDGRDPSCSSFPATRRRHARSRDVPGVADTVLELEVTPNRGDCSRCSASRARSRRVTGRALRHAARARSASAARRRPSERPRPRSRRRDLLPARTARASCAACASGRRRCRLRLRLPPRRHAPHQQRRRRHQLRDARARPAAARVRPRRASPTAQIVVRRARRGEPLVTLDGVERHARGGRPGHRRRARAPVALAGVMGGEESRGQAETTRDVAARERVLPAGERPPDGAAARAARRRRRTASSAGSIPRRWCPARSTRSRRSSRGSPAGAVAPGVRRGGAGRARRWRRARSAPPGARSVAARRAAAASGEMRAPAARARRDAAQRDGAMLVVHAADVPRRPRRSRRTSSRRSRASAATTPSRRRCRARSCRRAPTRATRAPARAARPRAPRRRGTHRDGDARRSSTRSRTGCSRRVRRSARAAVALRESAVGRD